MTRKQRQKEACYAWIESSQRSIINACPRFGKIKTTLDIIEKLDNPKNKILIVYPRVDIKQGWVDDCVKWNIWPNFTFTTYRSLKNWVNHNWDLIIYDELHEASAAQLEMINKIDHNIPVLGLTGTVTMKTEDKIYDATGINICYVYDIHQGVEEGILCDYEIFIHHVPLDDKELTYRTAKGKAITEKKLFDNLSFISKKLKMGGKNFFFMDLKRISAIQESLAKLEYTKKLILKYQHERILAFCGTKKIADSIGIPSYHSSTKDKGIFTAFCNGEGKHLVTIKMMQAGVTVLPIHRGIVNYISGSPETAAQIICRFLGFEYQNTKKKAELHIVCSTEKFEIDRMRTAMLFFNKEKIHLINFPHEQEKQDTKSKTTKTGIGGQRKFS